MRLGAILIASLASPCLAGEFSLSHPVDCAVGEDQTCYIQSYMDRDPGAGTQDYTCGDTTYDGHKGTDFALRSHADIANNTAVFAAAPGRVRGTRDGMEDRVFRREDAAKLEGRDCGNGVVIDHGDGWETQYCHLRQGSVAVSSGQMVMAGDILGRVGMSGRASYPHLHMSLRKDGAPVDPFAPFTEGCGDTTDTLWAKPPEYHAAGLISAGFSQGVPDYGEIKAGTAHAANLSLDSPGLVLWAYFYESRPSDLIRFGITGPNGASVFERDVTLETGNPQGFRASGRKTSGAAWFKPGHYTGTVALLRNGTVISDMTTTVTVAR